MVDTSSHDDTIHIIVRSLIEQYPNATIALHYNSPWELLVAVILSAQCTDKMVNRVTESLFRKYTTLESYCRADRAEFEKAIKPTGFYKNKTKHILETARIIKEKYKGILPKSIREMILLPGVARKTANVVLSNAYDINEGIAVDTHVIRISQRLRLVDLKKIGGKKEAVYINASGKTVIDFKKDADPVKIENELMDRIPKHLWKHLTYAIIDHGRSVCKALRPDCSHCMIRNVCAVARISSRSTR